MSRSPYFFIEHFDDKRNEWVRVQIYNSEKKPIDFWPWNGTHDIFEIFEEDNYEYEFVHFVTPTAGFSEEVMKEIAAQKASCDGYFPSIFWANLADMEIYALKVPKVIDEDATEQKWEENSSKDYDEIEKVYKPNPFIDFINRVINWVELGECDYFFNIHTYSDVRVVGWIW